MDSPVAQCYYSGTVEAEPDSVDGSLVDDLHSRPSSVHAKFLNLNMS